MELGRSPSDPSKAAALGGQLMEVVLDRGQDAVGVRLVQDAFNTRSVALYASLGFDVREPLLLMRGTPRSRPSPDFSVRPMTQDDVSACMALCMNVHGTERSSELRNAIQLFTPFVVERGSRVTGYLSAATFWIMNHGVAETEQDMEALIMGAASMSSEPVSFLLPSRQASFFRLVLGRRAEGHQTDDPDDHGQIPGAERELFPFRSVLIEIAGSRLVVHDRPSGLTSL